MRALNLTLLSVLFSCAPSVFRAEGWAFRVGSVSGWARLVPSSEFKWCPAQMIGCTVPLGHSCLVMLDRDKWSTGNTRYRTHLLAHEVGHCLDGSTLEYSHAGIRHEGRVYGAYYAAPAEGFAEAFAIAYLAACGENPAPLGYGQGPACELPDPRQIKVR